MKVIIVLIAVFSILSCKAQDRKTIVPSGNIVTKNVSVNSFNQVQASGVYELILKEGDRESVSIEADDNVQDLFKVSVNNNKLVLDMPELKNANIKSDDKERKGLKWKVNVTYKKLTDLDISLVGTVTCANTIKADNFDISSKAVGDVRLQIVANKLNVENKGVGHISLTGSATTAVIHNAGVGDFDGKGLLVQNMQIDNTGVGGAEVNVEKTLKVKQSFLGKVKNKGNAKVSKGEGVEI